MNGQIRCELCKVTIKYQKPYQKHVKWQAHCKTEGHVYSLNKRIKALEEENVALKECLEKLRSELFSG